MKQVVGPYLAFNHQRPSHWVCFVVDEDEPVAFFYKPYQKQGENAWKQTSVPTEYHYIYAPLENPSTFCFIYHAGQLFRVLPTLSLTTLKLCDKQWQWMNASSLYQAIFDTVSKKTGPIYFSILANAFPRIETDHFLSKLNHLYRTIAAPIVLPTADKEKPLSFLEAAELLSKPQWIALNSKPCLADMEPFVLYLWEEERLWHYGIHLLGIGQDCGWFPDDIQQALAASTFVSEDYTVHLGALEEKLLAAMAVCYLNLTVYQQSLIQAYIESGNVWPVERQVIFFAHCLGLASAVEIPDSMKDSLDNCKAWIHPNHLLKSSNCSHFYAEKEDEVAQKACLMEVVRYVYILLTSAAYELKAISYRTTIRWPGLDQALVASRIGMMPPDPRDKLVSDVLLSSGVNWYDFSYTDLCFIFDKLSEMERSQIIPADDNLFAILENNVEAYWAHIISCLKKADYYLGLQEKVVQPTMENHLPELSWINYPQDLSYVLHHVDVAHYGALLPLLTQHCSAMSWGTRKDMLKQLFQHCNQCQIADGKTILGNIIAPGFDQWAKNPEERLYALSFLRPLYWEHLSCKDKDKVSFEQFFKVLRDLGNLEPGLWFQGLRLEDKLYLLNFNSALQPFLKYLVNFNDRVKTTAFLAIIELQIETLLQKKNFGEWFSERSDEEKDAILLKMKDLFCRTDFGAHFLMMVDFLPLSLRFRWVNLFSDEQLGQYIKTSADLMVLLKQLNHVHRVHFIFCRTHILSQLNMDLWDIPLIIDVLDFSMMQRFGLGKFLIQAGVSQIIEKRITWIRWEHVPERLKHDMMVLWVTLNHYYRTQSFAEYSIFDNASIKTAGRHKAYAALFLYLVLLGQFKAKSFDLARVQSGLSHEPQLKEIYLHVCRIHQHLPKEAVRASFVWIPDLPPSPTDALQ